MKKRWSNRLNSKTEARNLRATSERHVGVRQCAAFTRTNLSANRSFNTRSGCLGQARLRAGWLHAQTPDIPRHHLVSPEVRLPEMINDRCQTTRENRIWRDLHRFRAHHFTKAWQLHAHNRTNRLRSTSRGPTPVPPVVKTKPQPCRENERIVC